MMSDDFIEGKKKEVVIKDFSAEGVEAFLCFFYTGTLDISQVDVIVEVQVLADKISIKFQNYTACAKRYSKLR